MTTLTSGSCMREALVYGWSWVAESRFTTPEAAPPSPSALTFHATMFCDGACMKVACYKVLQAGPDCPHSVTYMVQDSTHLVCALQRHCWQHLLSRCCCLRPVIIMGHCTRRLPFSCSPDHTILSNPPCCRLMGARSARQVLAKAGAAGGLSQLPPPFGVTIKPTHPDPLSPLPFVTHRAPSWRSSLR